MNKYRNYIDDKYAYMYVKELALNTCFYQGFHCTIPFSTAYLIKDAVFREPVFSMRF